MIRKFGLRSTFLFPLPLLKSLKVWLYHLLFCPDIPSPSPQEPPWGINKEAEHSARALGTTAGMRASQKHWHGKTELYSLLKITGAKPHISLGLEVPTSGSSSKSARFSPLAPTSRSCLADPAQAFKTTLTQTPLPSHLPKRPTQRQFPRELIPSTTAIKARNLFLHRTHFVSFKSPWVTLWDALNEKTTASPLYQKQFSAIKKKEKRKKETWLQLGKIEM